MNEITLSISIFSIWPPVLEAVGPFFGLSWSFCSDWIFCAFWWVRSVLLLPVSFICVIDPLADRLFLLLTVVWKMMLIYSFWCVFVLNDLSCCCRVGLSLVRSTMLFVAGLWLIFCSKAFASESLELLAEPLSHLPEESFHWQAYTLGS